MPPRTFKMLLPGLLWVLLLCTLWFPSQARTQTRTGGGPATVENIAVAPDGDRVRISITTGAPTKPVVSRLSHPERLVLDFPQLVLPRPQRIAVNQGTVARVRAAEFQFNPPVARVVVDLQQPAAYELQSAGNVVTVSISTGSPAGKLNTSNPPHPGPKPSAARTMSPPAYRASEPARVPPAVAIPKPAPPPARQPSSGAVARVPLQPVPIPGWDTESQPGALQVTFQNGLLTVTANNATFSEVFREIGLRTGAEVDMPAMPDRVLTKRGPGSTRDVISQLLEGSNYDFELLESMSGRLRKIIIVRK